MRRYTIAKTLTLFLGVLSVVARSLPERRSEVNVRSPGGKQFDISRPLSLTTLALLFCPHYCHNHTPLIPDVGNPKQRLEELGFVKVSEGVLDGNIHTAAYSMSNHTTVPKRDTTVVNLT